MPNWTNCTLTVSGPCKAIDDFMSRIKSKEKDENGKEPVFSIESVYPIPKKLQDGDGWYDWCVANWSTKWDVNSPELVELTSSTHTCKVLYSFMSAWAPPTNAIKKISEIFPWLKFKLVYYEGGMAFAGKDVFKAGENIKSNSLEGSGISGWYRRNGGI